MARPAPQDVKSVLLADDEAQALKWFARSYSDEFTVLTADGAEQALAILDQRADDIAVLLTDYRMPVRNGLDLLLEVRRRHEHISRLLMSAYADKDVAVAAVNHGHVDAILEKPLDESLTRQALRDARDACQRRLRDQQLLSQRDETLRETLGFLAHELRSPLATVSGYLSALRNRHQEPVEGQTDVAGLSQQRPGEVLAMLEAALRRTEYAQSLVTSFVRTARDAYHADGTASQTASDLIRSVQEGYPFDGGEAQWVETVKSHDFTLTGQRDLLYLVLCTLVKNSLLALHAQPPAEPRIRLVIEQEDGADVIRVADNGPGIAPDVLGRLTREPVSTRAASGGSGMGLMFCQRVMTSLNGRVEVASAPQGGATVSLYFKHRDGEHKHEAMP